MIGQISVMEQYSPLLQIIVDQLTKNSNYSQQDFNDDIIEDEPLNLVGIQYKNYMYVSDLKNTIQFVLPGNGLQNPTIDFATTPFNFTSNQHYRQLNEGKYQFWQPYLTQKQQFLEGDVQEHPHAFCPRYFFGKHFQHFVESRPNKREVLVQCRKIEIERWKLKIVNISKTGYYAPVIEPVSQGYKFKTAYHQSFECDIKNIQLILYEEKIREVMDGMRIRDIRNRNAAQKPGHSIFINIHNSEKKGQKNNVCRSDLGKQKINVDKNKSMSLITFGQFDDLNILTPQKFRPGDISNFGMFQAMTKQYLKQKQGEEAQLESQEIQSQCEQKGFNQHVQNFLDDWSDEEEEEQQQPQESYSRVRQPYSQDQEYYEPQSKHSRLQDKKRRKESQAGLPLDDFSSFSDSISSS